MSFGRDGTATGWVNSVGLAPRRARSAGPRTGAFRSRRTPVVRTMRSRASRLRHMDWLLAGAVAALSAIGVVVVYAATAPSHADVAKQALFTVVGLAVMLAIGLVDHRQIRIYAPIVYGISLLSLVAVLVPHIGTTINGSKGWIALPGFDVEPPEFAKIAMILMIAVVFAELRDRAPRPLTGSPRPGPRDMGLALACGLPMVALIFKEPALGMAIVLLASMIGMIVLAGVRWRWLLALAVVAGAAAAAVVGFGLVKSYQVQRITSFLHPSGHQSGSAYQATEAKIAVGSGGLFGQGLFHGNAVAGGYVPSQSTDFIFTVAGQELGFVGAIVIVALLAVVVIRALRIASRADDLFGMLVAAGIAIWFIVQSFINIGMTIGVSPITGIPLPFVSYGGSALVTDMIAVGVLQSVHRRHKVYD